MVFDVELEHNSVLYLCTVMQRQDENVTFFAVDIRIPGRGDSLSTQVHSLELDKAPAGHYMFRTAVDGLPTDMDQLAAKLGEAIEATLYNK